MTKNDKNTEGAKAAAPKAAATPKTAPAPKTATPAPAPAQAPEGVKEDTAKAQAPAEDTKPIEENITESKKADAGVEDDIKQLEKGSDVRVKNISKILINIRDGKQIKPGQTGVMVAGSFLNKQLKLKRVELV